MKSKIKFYNQFINKADLEVYVDYTRKVVREFYTERNLLDHSAYFSDQKPGRVSYGFSICFSKKTSNLPAIQIESIENFFPGFTSLTKKVIRELKLGQTTRLLFNIQLYENHSSPIEKHFDGEFLDFSVLKNNKILVKYAIRPRHVALLTLKNCVYESGTRFFSHDGSTCLATTSPGDLLVFDNLHYEHGVDSISENNKIFSEDTIRIVIGWRSIDEDCVLWKDGKSFELSTDEAVLIHEKWLKTQWSSIYNTYMLGSKHVPF